ncbi:MAG: hypothetical protein E6J13_03470, partial [Chloroflexi bacterium]
MGMVHVSAEELSALLDGELSSHDEVRARQHLTECASCSAEYALSVRLDEELRQPPVLACVEVVEVLSAGLDREASEGEQAAAQRHLAGCQDCRASVQVWTQVASAIKALPVVAPSARVDDAIYAIARSRRTYRPAPVRGIAARALITVTAVVAVIVASLGSGASPQNAVVPSPTGERVIVASIQQIVFNARNNTLYVLDIPGAAVDAREPGTNELKTRIQVGGEPTALALNEAANRVLVLDAGQKLVTEIDAVSNTVIGATTVAVAGTPTSISVDPSTNSIVVSSTAKSPAPGAAGGSVTVINSDTKQLETVREFNVAPRLVVPDQRSGRSALVSADATQIVDGSYRVLATLPGGVSAAFSKRDDFIVVLSPSGADSLLTFAGFGAPEPLKLTGAPRALTALPDGGYLVLVDLGGRGRVSRISRDGIVSASAEVAVTGGDLIYDDSTNRFTVANNGRLDTAQMPGQAATATTAPPTQSADASASPSPTPPPSAVATASPQPPATIGPNILAQARVLSPGVYNLPLPNGIQPQFAAAHGSRLWILDQSNKVSAFDMNTGDLFDIGALGKGATVTSWVAGGSYVYGIDAKTGEVNVVNTTTALLVDSTSTLWVGTSAGEIYSVRGGAARLTMNLQRPVHAFAPDQSGRAWYLAPLPSGLTGYAYG